ncbi:hypothetical protein GJ496_006535 [Pomphorhynchus laevis]|nr:hypothetical protein GJ496_006535 [Pomphorhynchus laevis]KAI0980025.1 hypothetical protein GJ496_006535 [Pomphorhynchus laevis]
MLLHLALILIFAAFTYQSQGNVYNAKFDPSSINTIIKSEINLSIYLYWTSHSPSSKSAQLLCINKGATSSQQNGTIFKFDNDWTKTLLLYFPNIGIYDYYIRFINETRDDTIHGSIRIRIFLSKTADILNTLTGWLSFFLWSASFYPQVILNQKRKSVVGLSFDYTAIDLLGYIPFTIYNCLIYFPSSVQNKYQYYHPHQPIPIELNDVIYTIHVTVLCFIRAVQCCIFERGNQRITKFGYGFIIFEVAAFVISGILCSINVINILQFVYVFSFVKVVSTLIKYIPQVYFNYQRKSTTGWSIWNAALDVSGAFFISLQPAINCINFKTWTVITGNPAKFILGLISIVFDLIMIIQHYILYPTTDHREGCTLFKHISKRLATLKRESHTDETDTAECNKYTEPKEETHSLS